MNNIKCGVYLRAPFISLEVNVGGGVYSRAALNRVNTVYAFPILSQSGLDTLFHDHLLSCIVGNYF